MKHVLPYSLFENQTAIQTLSKEQVSWLDNCTKGTWQLNPQTGEVDVDGGFNCSGQGLSDFKGVRFGEVKGYFSCSNNKLTSLEGAPREVGGGFSCSENQLTSLEGAPRKVGEIFICQSNQLTSLEGAPREVGWSFYCKNNPVPEKILRSIFGIMETGKGYLEATEYLWDEIPLDDQALLYRPEFEWIGAEEARKLDALKTYQGFKGMI